MRIAVLGRGAWGSALAETLRRAGRDVADWHRDADDGAVTGAEALLVAVPAQATRQVLTRLAGAIGPDAIVVLTAKGIERESGAFQSDVAREALPGRAVAVLSGPSFADDLTAGLPTAVTLAVGEGGEPLQQALATPSLRPYLSADVRGAEIGGALKNVYAIACGAAIGAGLGESARAALMARAFAEMIRFAAALGGRAETLGGLSGLGDLALTCHSPTSRNFAFGEALGRGRTPAEIRSDGRTYEGALTAAVAARLALSHGTDAPIASAVASLAEGEATVAETASRLFNRPLTTE